MSDDLERIVQRDLDRLPLLPPERWVPQPKRPSPLTPGWLRPLVLVPVTLMIALVAIALGWLAALISRGQANADRASPG